jgi:hypothetical protein
LFGSFEPIWVKPFARGHLPGMSEVPQLGAMALLWRIPEDYPEEAIGTYDRTTSPDRFLLVQGKRLSIEGIPKICFNVPSEILLGFDCLPVSSRVPLVSSRVKEALAQLCPCDVQFLETSVEAVDCSLSTYWLLHITHFVQGLDHARSIYTRVRGTDRIWRFRRCHYRQDCLGAHHIAREAEYFPHILASTQLWELFRDLIVTGVNFKFAEELTSTAYSDF